MTTVTISNIQIPRLFCEFENYTMTFDWLIYTFAVLGLIFFVYMIYELFGTWRNGK